MSQPGKSEALSLLRRQAYGVTLTKLRVKETYLGYATRWATARVHRFLDYLRPPLTLFRLRSCKHAERFIYLRGS